MLNVSWRRLVFLLPLCAALPGGAAAAQTALNISATGEQLVVPDEMVAALTVQASAAKAAAAQDLVNRAMLRALAAARAVSGVTATTSNYSVEQVSPENAPLRFQASQDLQLVVAAPGGVPTGAFTALVGVLQQDGLLLNTLDGDLSLAGQRTAESAAIADAIQQIQAQASGVATVLKEKIGGIKSLSVNAAPPSPLRGPVLMMAATAPPPQAAPGRISVRAEVTAVIELTAKP
jgi:uncharacterized protein YggE